VAVQRLFQLVWPIGLDRDGYRLGNHVGNSVGASEQRRDD
jgi:hypothetical protein